MPFPWPWLPSVILGTPLSPGALPQAPRGKRLIFYLRFIDRRLSKNQGLEEKNRDAVFKTYPNVLILTRFSTVGILASG
jgi:hypothetical protein